MVDKFQDGPTIEGPLQAFLQPGSPLIFQRGEEGVAIVDRVDVDANTIWLRALPPGIKPGDFIRGG